MRSVKSLLAAGAATLISSMAFAADMPIAAPPPMYAPPAPPADFGGWYLRGDIGISNQKVKQLNPSFIDPGISIASTQGLGFDSAGIFGLGAGYKFNNWFRADVTGEYRSSANLHGLQVINFNGVPAFTDEYHGSKSEWLILANAYVDLGTWWCVTPFIGAGVGASRNTISNFQDINTPLGGAAFASNASQWNFAWAAHAGLAYKVNPSLTLELAYRYVDLGDAVTGTLTSFDGVNRGRTMQFKDITSHDLKFGVRWDLSSPPVYAPPLVTKG
ncbi:MULTISPECIES: outer membrane protein [Bradyrhizobium]|uniref:Porin family protein n=1 Tax=Bradyrhizobium zhanjiangense TaxID=1325107 RepID=A0A4Q0QJX6_9BRAD|nr:MULTISPECIES: outer membrane beta-barrel protein [Bradyrhizobium]RXG93956.1 porin family protein [Bradyrhizobium zhanjiangense]UQR64803.1 outer membrane beta-barrel protein [Bradyrhizobium sp. C-145]